MELKYEYLLPVGAAVSALIVVLFFLFSIKKRTYKSGIKAANLDLLKDDPYFKRKLYMYYALRGLFLAAIVGVVMASFVLLARPYHVNKTKEQRYSRDIIICLDVSTSVNDLNVKLTKELQDTVRGLTGERVGIVIFNTSPVLLAPLTDDYDYIIDQLNNIREAIKATDASMHSSLSDRWLYWNSFLFGGTLVGNEERGSSLIGDGLLGAMFNFSRKDKDRTKIVIFATDNDPYGTGFVTLPEAAELCKKNNVVVYGIGTKEMVSWDMEEMRACMEKTGGKFYLEEDSSTFSRIVEDIESQSASLVEGRTIIREVDDPLNMFRILTIGFGCMLLLAILLRRANIFWGIRQVAVIALLAVFFTTVVAPAGKVAEGEGRHVTSDSNKHVLFIIDNTISMLAEDGKNGQTRLDALKADCAKIVEELDGARFSVISFNNEASIMSPFTNNGEHIESVIDALYPLETLYAKGTTMNTVFDTALESLQFQAGEKKQKAAVFFISDGEVTNGEAVKSFAELSEYIKGGAVLGYGTAAGGQMHIQGPYDDEPSLVEDQSDYPYKPAVSRIDESNLKKIASDMKVSYVNMNSGMGLDKVLKDIKADMDVVVKVEEPPKKGIVEVGEKAGTNPGYYLLIPILGMLLLEAFLFARKK